MEEEEIRKTEEAKKVVLPKRIHEAFEIFERLASGGSGVSSKQFREEAVEKLSISDGNASLLLANMKGLGVIDKSDDDELYHLIPGLEVVCSSRGEGRKGTRKS